MMKYILTLVSCLSLIAQAKTQTVSNINFDAIKKDITATGPNNYETLLKRLNAADTTLTADNYQHLYFGQVFQPNYSPYGDVTALSTAEQLISKDDIGAGKVIIDGHLKAHPVSLGAIYDEMVIMYKQHKADELRKWAVIYRGLIAAITTSGDGKTDNTAMVVANVPDEYKVLPALHVKFGGKQSLTSNQCDILTLEQPNNSGLTEVHFNVSKALAKGFN